MRTTTSYRVLLLPVLVLGAGCGGPTVSVDGGADATMDAAIDPGRDAPVMSDDVTLDAGHDAGPDVGATDAGDDAGSDAGSDASMADAPACMDCLTETVTWGFEGGRALFSDASALEVCRTFRHTRTPRSGAPTTCSNVVACASGAALDMSDVNDALADPDVRAALASAPATYGRDTRPVDGSIFHLTVGTRSLWIGEPCGGAAGCTPIPAGLSALQSVLTMLTTQQLGLPSCDTAFP